MGALVSIGLAAASTGCVTNEAIFYGLPASVEDGNGNGDDHEGTGFATETAAVSAGTVPAPSYTIGFGTFSVLKDVNDIVQSVSGYAQLTAGSSTGQDYAICDGALTGASTLAAVETAYNGAGTTGLLSALTTLELPAAGFDLLGLDLDTTIQRTVILRASNEGVSSYQLLLVTFP